MADFALNVHQNPIDTLFTFEICNGVSIGCGIPSKPSKPLFTLLQSFEKAPINTGKRKMESTEAVETPPTFFMDTLLTKIEEEPNYFSDTNEEFCSDTTDNYDDQNNLNQFPFKTDETTSDIAYDTVLPDTLPNLPDAAYPKTYDFYPQSYGSTMPSFGENPDSSIISNTDMSLTSSTKANNPPSPLQSACDHHHYHESSNTKSKKTASKLSALAIEFVPKRKVKRKPRKPTKPPRRCHPTRNYTEFVPIEPKPASKDYNDSNSTILALLSNAVKMRLN